MYSQTYKPRYLVMWAFALMACGCGANGPLQAGTGGSTGTSQTSKGTHTTGSTGATTTAGTTGATGNTVTTGNTGTTGTTGNTGTTGTPGTTTSPNSPLPGAATKFVNPQSNLCLDLRGASSANGAPFQLWYCNGLAPQRYTASASGTWQQLLTQVGGKCISIAGDTTQNGAAVVQEPCAQSDGQLLQLVPATGNTYSFKFKDGHCLDIPNGATTPGTALQQFDCNGSAGQLWAPLESTFDDGNAYTLTNAGTQKCIDDLNYGINDGNPVIEYDCNAAGNQAYTFNFMGVDATGAGYYEVIDLNASKCLDVINASTAAATQVQLYSCLGASQFNQHWQVVGRGSGAYSLQARHSGQMLDLPSGNAANLTPIQQFPDDGGSAQRWLLNPTDGGFGAPNPGGVQYLGDIGAGGDPGIVFWQGYYYYTMSGFAQSFSIAASAHLNTVLNADAGFFTWNDTVDASFHAESPEPAIITDPRNGQQKLAIYVTDALPYPGRIRVVLWSGPTGGFEDMGYLANVGGYDPHYMAHPNGQAYLLFSSFNQVQIIQLSNPWTTTGASVPITTATYPWELQENSIINEAPTHVISGNTVNMVYTANWVDHATYECGLATAPVSADPMNPASWTKHVQGPIFAPANGLYGIGSGNFVSDGTNTWWSYQSVVDVANPVRRIHSQTAWFNANGVVQLGQPR